MKNLIAETGNSGPKVRSDCQIRLDLSKKNGIRIDLNSKVKSMYGSSITEMCMDILRFNDIKNASLEIIDTGALPYVIMARLEAAIRTLIPVENEYLPDMIEENKYQSDRFRFRFSRLYLPGNTPSMMINAGLYSASGIILDLEDSVAPAKKGEARLLVRNALRQINFYGAERMVRINQGEMGLEDLNYVVPHNLHLILIPKCEDPTHPRRVSEHVDRIRKEKGIESQVYLMPIIESALGVERAYEIANSSANIVAMAIGLEDYTADLGVQRTVEGGESLYARLRIINASKAAGIQPIDSVFSDVSDLEALEKNVKASKSIGFEGMGCIHPRQIAVINRGFAPEPEEIEKAARIVLAFKEAEKRGEGVVSVGSKMIDPPVLKRAEKTICLALRLKLIPEDWETEMLNQE